MKPLSFLPFIAALILSGCLKEKRTLTVYPDGSGKVVIEAARRFQSQTFPEWNDFVMVPFDTGWLVQSSRGIDAWTLPQTTISGDWRHQRITAYFDDIRDVALPGFKPESGKKKIYLTTFELETQGERFVLRVREPLTATLFGELEDVEGEAIAKPTLRDAGLPWFERALWEDFHISEVYDFPGFGREQTQVSVAESDIFQDVGDDDRYWNKPRILELAGERIREIEGSIGDGYGSRPPEFAEELSEAKAAWRASSWKLHHDLIRAVRMNDVRATREALAAGANPNDQMDGLATGETSCRCVSYAAARGHNALITTLIEHGADINAEVGPSSPLHLASGSGHIGTLELLLQKGADVEKQGATYGPETPWSSVLDLAVLRRQKEAVLFWLARDLEVTPRTLQIAGNTTKYGSQSKRRAGKEILSILKESLGSEDGQES